MSVKSIDKAISKIEAEAVSTEAPASETLPLGDVGTETTAQSPEVDTTSTEEAVVDTAPEAEAFDWEKEIASIEEMLKAPVQIKEQAPQEETPSEQEQELFRQKYEDELSKRIALQSEKSELEAMVKYQQTLLDKQSDKHLTIIDKQKDLEAELRRAKLAATPDEITPLAQSYVLFKENNAPVHKNRVIVKAIEFIQNITWVSGEDYLQKIYLAENKDIPQPEANAAPVMNLPKQDSKPQYFASF